MNEKKCNLFTSDEYINVIVEYDGDVLGELDKLGYGCGKLLSSKNAVLAIKKGSLNDIEKYMKTIVYIDRVDVYTLSEISPIDSNGISKVQINPYLNLRGAGTLVGIIDTGIDYLNEEFMYEDNTTRIAYLWDQSIENPNEQDTSVIFGTLYDRETINKAIAAKQKGEDPYSIVASKDEIGHGTNMAGIVGGRGKNSELKSAAPECEFVIVKLVRSNAALNLAQDVPAYSGSDIMLAMQFLSQRSKSLNKPMVILVPLGSNFGAHNGTSGMEVYLRNVINIKNIAVVVSAGNEANKEIHTSGYIKSIGGTAEIELKIGEGELDFQFEIWVKISNKMAISVVSPTGEVIKSISPKLKEKRTIKFILESTILELSFAYPEERSGNELIIVRFKNPTEGIWKFILIGEVIVDGRYDAWLPQRSLLKGDTRFLSPDQYTTIVTPGNQADLITVGFYDQNNNSTVAASGLGYTTDNVVKPDLVAGGVNVLTTQVGGGLVTVSGSSVAAAVVAGACAIIMQWGVVEGNDYNMYISKVKTYLLRGVTKRYGDVYPNPEWGYGQLNLYGVFEELRGMYRHEDEKNYRSIYKNNIFIRYDKAIGL
jgi:hypothetical protein